MLRLARENSTWGYDRIQGALANLGYEVSDQTVGSILQEHGIEPADRRQHYVDWGTFLRAHWDVLAAIDFTTVEVWTKGGLVTYYLLFVMELRTRKVHFAGCTVNPHGQWMQQVARNVTDCDDGFLLGKRYLIMDRDTKFTSDFRRRLKDSGIKSVRLPPRSPKMSAHLERFMRSVKSEALFEGNSLGRELTAQRRVVVSCSLPCCAKPPRSRALQHHSARRWDRPHRRGSCLPRTARRVAAALRESSGLNGWDRGDPLVHNGKRASVHTR